MISRHSWTLGLRCPSRKAPPARGRRGSLDSGQGLRAGAGLAAGSVAALVDAAEARQCCATPNRNVIHANRRPGYVPEPDGYATGGKGPRAPRGEIRPPDLKARQILLAERKVMAP